MIKPGLSSEVNFNYKELRRRRRLPCLDLNIGTTQIPVKRDKIGKSEKSPVCNACINENTRYFRFVGDVRNVKFNLGDWMSRRGTYVCLCPCEIFQPAVSGAKFSIF